MTVSIASRIFSGTPQALMQACLADLARTEAADADQAERAGKFQRALNALVGLHLLMADHPVVPEGLSAFRERSAKDLLKHAARIGLYVVETLTMAEEANANSDWPELCLRRSIIQCLLDDYAGTAIPRAIDPSKLAELDDQLRRVGEDLGPVDNPALERLPASHWWWSVPESARSDLPSVSAKAPAASAEAASDATTALPTWRDGWGGALMLLADLFSDADVASLAGRYPVTERFLPHEEGFVSTRWPGSIDAALATMAARALTPTIPELANTLREVWACDRDVDRLRSVFTRYHEGFMEQLSSSPPDATLTNAHWVPRAVVLAHLGAASGVPAFHAHRRIPTPAAESVAALLRVAIEEHGLPPSALIDTIAAWAPTEHHGSRVQSTDDRLAAVATWPDLALVVDGAVPDGCLAALAADVAASRESTGEAIVAQALERLNRELPSARGLGVVLLSGTKAFGAIQGTVRCYPHPGPQLNGSVTHFTADVTTLLLSTVPLAPEDDPSTFPDPSEVHAAFERVSLRSLVSKMVNSLAPVPSARPSRLASCPPSSGLAPRSPPDAKTPDSRAMNR